MGRRAQPWLPLLGVLLILCGPSVAADTPEGLENAEELQAQYKEAPPVMSHIIEEADPADLWSGTGDVATTGKCQDDIKHFCKSVRPGEGRLAACLTNQENEETKGSASGKKMADECKKELREFKIDRGTNVNKDLKLAQACKGEVSKHCSEANMYPEPGAVLACLRSVKSKLEDSCKEEVTRTQMSAAKDYAVDAMLNEVCRPDAERLCEGVNTGNGRVQYCLRSQRSQLSWDCQEELFRQEVENADDVRLSVQLLRKCINDKRKYCNDVQPGNARVKECLEDNRNKPGFSSECRSELENVMSRRAGDFRLDPLLRELCKDDIEDVCGYEKDSLTSVTGDDGRVIECLQDYKDELQSPACRGRVHKLTARAASDIRFNKPLADACWEDRQELCKDVQPGDARMMRCLQDHRQQLTYECRATLFDTEVRLSENVDFQYPIKKHCTKEMERYCGEVPKGSGRVLSCLANSSPRDEFNSECRRAVERYEQRAGEDYRLNYRLNRACEMEVDRLCPDVCSPFQGSACGGTVLKCLSDKSSNITDQACRREVFNMQRGWARDYRTDAQLREACQPDADRLCPTEERGVGKVHECLRRNRNQLSKECAAQEMKLNILQASDIRLRPGMYQDCSEEIAVYCKGVKAGRARVYRCLQSNMGRVDFSQQCRRRLRDKLEAQQSYYKLDYGVKSACKGEVERLCKEEESASPGSGTILRCLVSKYDQMQSDACKSEVSRAVRTALWQYRKGAPLTAACDIDAGEHCEGDDRGQAGSVGRCLASRVAEGEPLSEACHMLVSLAAPSDPKQLFDDQMTTAAVVSRVEKVEEAASKYGFARRDAYGKSVVTLTGWVALASFSALITLIILGAVFAYRRYTGRAGNYTLVVKGGDV